jgi:transposase
MIFAQVETKKAKKELQEALKGAKKSYLYRRLLIIQLSSEGKSVPELASMFLLSQAMVRQYIHDYNDGGLVKLRPKKKPGRKAKFSLSQEQWSEILHQSPCLFEKLECANHNWTLQLLASYIKEYHGVSMSLSGIWYQLRQAKITMGRSKLRIPCQDADYIVKRQRVEGLKKKPKLAI